MHLALKPTRPDKPELPDIVVVPRRLRVPLAILLGVLAVSCGTFAAFLMVAPFFDHESDTASLTALFVIAVPLPGLRRYLAYSR